MTKVLPNPIQSKSFPVGIKAAAYLTGGAVVLGSLLWVGYRGGRYIADKAANIGTRAVSQGRSTVDEMWEGL